MFTILSEQYGWLLSCEAIRWNPLRLINDSSNSKLVNSIVLLNSCKNTNKLWLITCHIFSLPKHYHYDYEVLVFKVRQSLKNANFCWKLTHHTKKNNEKRWTAEGLSPDYFSFVNYEGYEQRERLANSLTQTQDSFQLEVSHRPGNKCLSWGSFLKVMIL